IAGRLHRVADLALNVARQVGHLRHADFMDGYGLDEFFEEIELGLSLIRPALEGRKVKLVVRLCQVEGRLDALYAERFKRLVRELDEGCGQPGDRVTALMVVHYLERIGDLLLEIGELMIHIFFGENLNFAQYQALGAGLRAVGGELETAAAFQSIWGGRSGCRVGVVGRYGGDEVGRVDGQAVIFKHGPAAKLEKEQESLGFWASLRPGLCPAVKTFVPGPDGEDAALVMEYIDGPTLRDLFMNPGGQAEARAALTEALNLLAGVWRDTRREEAVGAGFIRQAEKRLGPLRALYPDLLDFSGSWGALRLRPLEDLLAEAHSFEPAAPFSVRLHGDFNLPNVMRDESTGKLRFIDLHRSRQGDYAQDVSVMMMSILRLPLSAREDRDRLAAAAGLAADFALKFAAENNDPSAQARLAFGLARSFLTSARFEPRRSAAVRFIGHSRHLLGRLIAFGRSGRPWPEFELDKRTLFVL
ncbi:MAG: phosphotransferase, partial [Candidatus Adiutrix sp.]|nr:phosphotransferase [Candidatus Adiutrix sp.]